MPLVFRCRAGSVAAALLCWLVALGGMAPCARASIATNSNTPLSTRVVDYSIDAHIDVVRHTVDATEILTYRNLTGQPLTRFPFHLYLNAFQPDSTFTSETHAGGGPRDNEAENSYPARKLGSITVAHLDAEGFGELTSALRYTAPDDGNANDRTVAELTLPRPVMPGESITFHIAFHDQFPESVARNGWKRDFLMGGQWYPKLGVFWHGAWNCHQYHADTEFFSDFGTFDVHLTLPRNYTLGASGVPTGDRTNSDGTRTLSFYGEDIHDFAWAASPHFQVLTSTYLSGMGPVQVRVLSLAAHPAAGPRYRDIILRSMAQFEQRYGVYPYKILTVVDPEPGSEIGGMEYPTLITGDASLLDPTLQQEVTTEHEFGHQYWYGMVATNEFEDAWLDEGINSYTEVNVTGAILGRDTSVLRLPWMNLSDASMHRLEYLAAPDFDPVTRHAWQFHDANSYAGVTYGKSGVLLATLRGIVGDDVMAEAMRTYFQRYRFTHPDTNDFLNTIVEVAQKHGRATVQMPSIDTSTLGEQYHVVRELSFGPFDQGALLAEQTAAGSSLLASSLTPFFNQAVFGTAMLDYAVDSIHTEPVHWWQALPHDSLRNTVTVHRLGDFTLPVTVEIVFSNGERLQEHWDGQDRWHTWTYDRAEHVVSAELDPAHTVPLDVDRFNDSRTEAAHPTGTRKLTSLWTGALQLASQLAGWLV